MSKVWPSRLTALAARTQQDRDAAAANLAKIRDVRPMAPVRALTEIAGAMPANAMREILATLGYSAERVDWLVRAGVACEPNEVLGQPETTHH